jgi:hypothetical protein
MSSNQRLEVWRGTRAKTSGGLTKADLTRNKRGKIVSKKKSQQAGSQNNLGSWLRLKGKKVSKDEMLRKKGDVVEESPKPKKAAKPAPKPKKAAKHSGSSASKKAVQQPAPKKLRLRLRLAAKPAPKAAKAKAAPKKPAPKKKAPPKITRKDAKPTPQTKINPLTKQAYAPKNKSGYVASGNVSLDNVKRRKLRGRKRKYDPSAFLADFGV